MWVLSSRLVEIRRLRLGTRRTDSKALEEVVHVEQDDCLEMEWLVYRIFLVLSWIIVIIDCFTNGSVRGGRGVYETVGALKLLLILSLRVLHTFCNVLYLHSLHLED